MDERNKLIKELEEKRRQDLAASEEALEKLGKKLLAEIEGRSKKGKSKKHEADLPETGAEEASGPDAAEEDYRRFTEEIAENKRQIEAAEDEAAKYEELAEEIGKKEKEHEKHTKEISALYVQIGRLVLADPSFADFTAAYQGEMEEILSTIDAREAKLEELDQKTGNIFTAIGKNAQSLVVKTLLMKNQADLHKVYRAAGEKFIADGESSDSGEAELKEAAGEAGKHSDALEELAAGLADLKEERKKTADRFKRNGSPNQRIKAHEKNIRHAGEETAKVSRRFGGFVLEPKYDAYFKALLGEDDKKIMSRASALRASAEETGTKIEKLRAAVAIDAEKKGIERLNKSIVAEDRKIKTAQDAIAGMENDIQAARDRIIELEKQL